IRFHDLRHSFASCLTMGGLDPRLVMELMRHKSLAMTQRYAHLHPDYLKGATEILCRTQTAHTARNELKNGT
ncbi:MAG: tyrosine-type recombinase/integrase, partial [Oligoflexales bacterium]|nr:tyrosine-type recombinase/integrase [Oligoflexales bacterium]